MDGIVLDPSSAVAPFEQLRRRIAERVGTGELEPGHRLPTVRALADHLGLAANTVAKAYRELEQDGVIVTRGRNGTFVAVRGEDAERELRAAAHAFARRVRELGADPGSALEAVRASLDGGAHARGPEDGPQRA